MVIIGCYSPLLRIEDLKRWEKSKTDGHMYHPANVISGTKNLEQFDFKTFKDKKVQWIPCQQCIGCNLDYSREWADRGYLESLTWGENKTWFVTLTINEESLIKTNRIITSDGFIYDKDEIENADDEWQGSLYKKTMKNFMKRLRKKLKTKYNIENIRCQYCGEYGSDFGRPHYHLILYNCPLPPESFYNPKPSWEKDIYYQNKIIEEVWSDPKTHKSWGISNIAEANWNTIAYVARYITKKLKGPMSEHEMAAIGRTKEFMHESTRPGIGWYYYNQHKDEIYKYDQILIQDRKSSHWVKPPTYFDNMYKIEYPDRWEEIQEKREKAQISRLLEKAEHTSLTRWEQLQLEMRAKQDSTISLKRTLNKADGETKASAILPQKN